MEIQCISPSPSAWILRAPCQVEGARVGPCWAGTPPMLRSLSRTGRPARSSAPLGADLREAAFLLTADDAPGPGVSLRFPLWDGSRTQNGRRRHSGRSAVLLVAYRQSWLLPTWRAENQRRVEAAAWAAGVTVAGDPPQRPGSESSVLWGLRRLRCSVLEPLPSSGLPAPGLEGRRRRVGPVRRSKCDARANASVSSSILHSPQTPEVSADFPELITFASGKPWTFTPQCFPPPPRWIPGSPSPQVTAPRPGPWTGSWGTAAASADRTRPVSPHDGPEGSRLPGPRGECVSDSGILHVLHTQPFPLVVWLFSSRGESANLLVFTENAAVKSFMSCLPLIASERVILYFSFILLFAHSFFHFLSFMNTSPSIHSD